ncbi:hypothetical protein RQM47_16305 [Rubrivirga sp. S365]|uniref:hypothetical protein n=1 Tax=Rubrivirga sp. S365 TaxID=3076080 RepID=UPI0028C89446|nr:hypothetical protein [Rubrivirga sp. S365]MDT7858212.1 hypothetical protein [Rubrivirga sp. S365]
MRPTTPDPDRHRLTPLPALGGGVVEAPPHFEALVGYSGDRRYVSFHLRLDGRPVVGDGLAERVGYHGPFQTWSHHPSVWPSLSSDASKGDPEPHVVLDRFTRRVYAGGGEDVRQFLSRAVGAPQPSPPLPTRPTFGELAGDGLADDPDPVRRAEFERVAGPRMVEWLDARPLPCPSCGAAVDAGDYGAGADGRPVCPECGAAFYGPPLFDRLAKVRNSSSP